MICRKPTEACKNPLPIAELKTGKPAMVAPKIRPDCSTVHDRFLWANKYVRSHLACEIAWRQTPETGSGDVAFTNWAAQVKMQK